VANQVIDCSRGLPHSPRLLRNDKHGVFICGAQNRVQPSLSSRRRLAVRRSLLQPKQDRLFIRQ
jgi:hypothetical protein